MLSNYRLADEALHAAAALCENDPLLCNERGVMAFNHGEYVFTISGPPFVGCLISEHIQL